MSLVKQLLPKNFYHLPKLHRYTLKTAEKYQILLLYKRFYLQR